MKNISFTSANKNIRYHKETLKGNAQNLYLQNKTLHLGIPRAIGIKNKKENKTTATTKTLLGDIKEIDK